MARDSRLFASAMFFCRSRTMPSPPSASASAGLASMEVWNEFAAFGNWFWLSSSKPPARASVAGSAEGGGLLAFCSLAATSLSLGWTVR